jgi:hypothetical protein
MTMFPDVSVADLENSYVSWPGDEYDKGKLWALILRVRIERVAAALPRTVIAARPDVSFVERRLFLSIGESALTQAEQQVRTAVVFSAVSVYSAICDLLHGRSADSNPPLQHVHAWTAAVQALEDELRPRRPASQGAAAGRAAPLTLQSRTPQLHH